MTTFPTPGRQPRLGVFVLLLALLVLLLLLLRGLSVIQVGSPALPPRPPQPSRESNPDLAREDRMRHHLEGERWEQVFGKDDRQIAQALRIAKQKCADFVGKRGDGDWLLAESKGSGIDDAANQLLNTLKALRANGVRINSVELRIYFNESTWARLTNPDPLINNFGYKVQDGLIVFRDAGRWVSLKIEGIAVQGFAAP